MHSKILCSRVTLCARAVVTGLAALLYSGVQANPKITEIDPAALSFAVAVPDAVRLQDGDASFVFEYRIGNIALNESFALELTPTTLVDQATNTEGPVYVGRLSAADRQRWVEIQKIITEAENAGQNGTGDAMFSLTGGCFLGSVGRSLQISTWIQTDAEDGYMEVMRDQDLFSMLDRPERQLLMDNLRSCD